MQREFGSFFGHLAHTAPEEDHHHVTATALRPPTENYLAEDNR